MGRSGTSVTRATGEWLTRPGTQALFDHYADAGHALYVVGGAVRNALLGRPVEDVDMASDMGPEDAAEMLSAQGVRVVPTGIDHGTITAISDGVAHEITTFRKDVETDGRHAIVRYSDRIEEDAARRDFTINALYADRDGRVLDPVGGLEDIDPPRIRFIGEARDRLLEDYLRGLRYFRFHAQVAPPGSGFDPDALNAIAATRDGLAQLSRERVGAEMMKLLGAPDPSEAVAAMAATGVLAALLPGADATALAPLVHVERHIGLAPRAILRLAAIIGTDAVPLLRLSRAQARTLADLRQHAEAGTGAGELGYRLGQKDGLSALALCAALRTRMPDTSEIDALRTGAAATFPLSGSDLAHRIEGPALGRKLRELEAVWIASGFVATKSDLLA